MKHQPETYNRIIEGIISSVSVDLNTNLSGTYRSNIRTNDHVILSNKRYIRISLNTDTRGGDRYLIEKPDFSFDNISIKIERRGIRDENLSEWVNDGTVNYDRINQAIAITAGRANALIDVVDDFIDRADYVCGIFNRREIELFKSYNLNINQPPNSHESLERLFEWKTPLSEGRRHLSCKKQEWGYSLEISERTVINTKDKFGVKKLTPYEIIYETPEGLKNCNEFMKLFSKVYEYYFG